MILLAVLQVNCKEYKKTQSAVEVKTSTFPHLVKTQGTNQYANLRCIVQDKAGNLWFGASGEGVYRYSRSDTAQSDAGTITNFTTKDGLSNNTVWSILVDMLGTVWLGTDDGLCKYENDTIIRVIFTTEKSKLKNTDPEKVPGTKHAEAVWSMMQAKNGKIWLGTNKGMYWFDGKTFTPLLNEPGVVNKTGFPLLTIGCMLEDKTGKIWLASSIPAGGEGLCMFDGHTIVRYNPENENWFRSIIEGKDGMLWIGTRHLGNWLYDGKTFSHFTLNEELGTPYLCDSQGRIWFAGEEHENGYSSLHGVWSYDGKTFKNYTTRNGMGNYQTWAITEDRDGNIWFGTRNNGVYRFDGKDFVSFNSESTTAGSSIKLPGNQ